MVLEGPELTESGQRHQLISVPLDSRPKPSEIKKYLRGLQAYALQLADELLKETEKHPNSMRDVERDVQRLITALATDLEHLRIPII